MLRYSFSPVASTRKSSFAGISVSGEYVKAPFSFPHVSTVEQDNCTTVDHIDSARTEKFATFVYEVNVHLAAINAYTGAYMSRYSRAEMTLGTLKNQLKKDHQISEQKFGDLFLLKSLNLVHFCFNFDCAGGCLGAIRGLQYSQ